MKRNKIWSIMKRNKRYKYRRKFFELVIRFIIASFEISILLSIIRIFFANVKNKSVICIVSNIIPIRLYCFEFYENKICFFFFIKSYIHINIKYLTYYKFYIEKFHPLCWICKFHIFNFYNCFDICVCMCMCVCIYRFKFNNI